MSNVNKDISNENDIFYIQNILFFLPNKIRLYYWDSLCYIDLNSFIYMLIQNPPFESHWIVDNNALLWNIGKLDSKGKHKILCNMIGI